MNIKDTILLEQGRIKFNMFFLKIKRLVGNQDCSI